ncbi:hypothetical protein BN3659_00971 [Alistipes sp. CHKCI003]|nr:hypothetical protein BN3659_00971 [Alistipes sp. CHKCI003]
MLDSPFFLPAAGTPGLGMFRTVRPVLFGPVRSCSVLFDPVRSCSILLGSVRFCAIRHDLATIPPRTLFRPASPRSILSGPGSAWSVSAYSGQHRGGEERFCRAQAPRTDKQHRENRPIRDIVRSDRENKLRTTEQTPPFHERDSARTYADIYRRPRCRSEHFDRIPPAYT